MAQAIQHFLVARDAADEGDVILEVRAGTGGDEAALFAGDLFRMYLKYAEWKRWKVEVLSTSEGRPGLQGNRGRISGHGVFARLNSKAACIAFSACRRQRRKGASTLPP